MMCVGSTYFTMKALNILKGGKNYGNNAEDAEGNSD